MEIEGTFGIGTSERENTFVFGRITLACNSNVKMYVPRMKVILEAVEIRNQAIYRIEHLAIDGDPNLTWDVSFLAT